MRWAASAILAALACVGACNAFLGYDLDYQLAPDASPQTDADAHSDESDGAVDVTTTGDSDLGGPADGSDASDEDSGSIPATGVTVAALGNGFTCAIKAGVVDCWGSNGYGQVNPTQVSATAPATAVQFGPASGPGPRGPASGIAAGDDFACALFGASVACWGRAESGELGSAVDASGPYEFRLMGGVALAAGTNHACVLSDQSAVRCWGANEHGQLGDGTIDGPVSAIPGVIALEAADGVTASQFFTCLRGDRDNGNKVFCWGADLNRELGTDQPKASYPSPMAVPILHGMPVNAITSGVGYVCALLTDNSVTCWGDDAPVPTMPQGVARISAGRAHVCAVLMDGSVQCAGDNSFGQLGVGDRVSHAGMVTVAGMGKMSARTVIAGATHTCAITPSNRLLCWGANTFNQISPDAGPYQLEPTDVTP
jgi:alpha-tubulin suppressor-like RCC1 family protein